MTTSDIQAFAAKEAIENGEWDKYLFTLSFVIGKRLRTLKKEINDSKANRPESASD